MATLLIYKHVRNRLTRVGKAEGSVPNPGDEFLFDGEIHVVSEVDMDVRHGRPPTIKVFLK